MRATPLNKKERAKLADGLKKVGERPHWTSPARTSPTRSPLTAAKLVKLVRSFLEQAEKYLPAAE